MEQVVYLDEMPKFLELDLMSKPSCTNKSTEFNFYFAYEHFFCFEYCGRCIGV